jgi:hypothetical protein
MSEEKISQLRIQGNWYHRQAEAANTRRESNELQALAVEKWKEADRLERLSTQTTNNNE